MKLIVAGSSGFVATEVIRQSLSIPKITSVIALARRSLGKLDNLEPGVDASKLQSVVLDSYGSYPDEVKKHFADADACIWTVAITPTKSKGQDFDLIRRVCQDDTLAGLEAMFEARADQAGSVTPFRFMYMSGIATERDQSKTPAWMPEYSLMRGETENRVLAFAAQQNGKMEACVAKPGLITAPDKEISPEAAKAMATGLPSIEVTEIAIAMLDQVINGFEMEPLNNNDLVRIARRVLKDAQTVL